MSSLQQVSEEIVSFLSNERAEAICVYGEWGVGKTFAWDRMFKEALQKGTVARRQYSYVSLFGLSHLEALKTSIFENSTILVDPNMEDENLKDAARLGSAVLAVAKKSRAVLAAIPYVGTVIKEAGPLYFATVRNEIVCIDDLERRGTGLSVRDVLGLVSFLKEQRNCKLIMLLNDQELHGDKQEFDDNYEKVFDASIRFSPTSAESTAVGITGDDEYAAILRHNCEQLGITNIRVLRKIERVARDLEPRLDGQRKQLKEKILHSLALLAWSKFQPTKAPPVDYILNGHSRAIYRLSANVEASKDELAWKAVLDKYGFHAAGDLEKCLLQSLDQGFIDRDAIGEQLAAAESDMERAECDEAISRAWQLFRAGFDDNVEEVISAMESAVAASKLPSVLNLDASVRLVKRLGFEDRGKTMVTQFVERTEAPIGYWDLGSFA